MAYPKFEMSFTSMAALLVVTMSCCCWHGNMAQSSDCTNAIISMSSCLNYIQGNTSTPSSGCCSQLSSVVNTQPQCLCQVLNGGGSSLGLNINQTQALQLPKACKVQTPPVTQCNNGAPSAKSPAGKAAPASPSTTVPSGKGSDSVPSSTDTNTSDATLIKTGASFFLLIILFMESYISSFINS